MTTTVQIDDPQGVINSLQARIVQLEGQIQYLRQSEVEGHATAVHAVLKSLRAHGVILLHLGVEDISKARERTEQYPLERVAMDQVWPLASAPVSADVKTALQKAANYGMNRWP